ncbi:heterokaryon incompatibility protein-domain-containing protein [Hypoxylon rubiginosum]|uniref:Heterokaryon incompatibility protein-domain-containing protein n=1 Tax=Hypoxylon rubiginosum TaxID=110542 RepID=A0ACB9Z305_9PEZI|nr:heterokaryon incompatibility protein-domain-containing protein [Hypoxylon rubiginosum]
MIGPYTYESIAASSASGARIRLLTLLPAESEADPIRCKLDIVALADRPAYEALSYCWGPPKPQRPIDCSGRPFHVGENLHSALCHLRRADEDRRLWVDAICINQDDLSEKADQVLRMRDIYRDARRVVVWLGVATPDSDLAFDTLRRLSGHWAEMSERWAADKLSVLKLGSFRNTLRQLFGVDAGRQKDIEDDPRFELQPREIAGLRDVLERSWWRRTWVIQEVCLAEQVVMVCGPTALSWEELSRGYLIAVGPGGLLAMVGNTEQIACCQKMYQLKTMCQEMRQQEATSKASPPSGHTATDLLTLVQSSNKFGTARYHDRIYGVLGLATMHTTKHSAETGVSIVPDYTISVEECFRNAATAIIMNSGNLDLFRDPTYLIKGRANRPSWVPHWGYDPFESSENEAWGPDTPFTAYMSIANLASLFRQEAELRACGESTTCAPRVIGSSILVLEGHIVDSIARIAVPLDGELDDDTEEKWALYAKQNKGVSLTTIPSLVSQVLIRVATFAGSLVDWEELAFANPARPTRAERESYIRAMLNDSMFQDIDVSLEIYKRDWSPLIKWLRRLSPLKAFGARPGALTLYNIAAGVLTVAFLAWSSTKSHLVTIVSAMESRMARTDAGRLARLPGAAMVGDKIALLKGSKMPVIIRPMENRWQFIGCGYVDGIMYGEGWRPDSIQEIEFI